MAFFHILLGWKFYLFSEGSCFFLSDAVPFFSHIRFLNSPSRKNKKVAVQDGIVIT